MIRRLMQWLRDVRQLSATKEELAMWQQEATRYHQLVQWWSKKAMEATDRLVDASRELRIARQDAERFRALARTQECAPWRDVLGPHGTLDSLADALLLVEAKDARTVTFEDLTLTFL